MAERRQEQYSIASSFLKPKYQSRQDAAPRIRAFCKDIERCTNARITVDVPAGMRAPVKFDIVGQSGSVRKAVEYIQGEFVVRKRPLRVDQDRAASGVPLPSRDVIGISGPRQAYEPLSEDTQQALILEYPGTPQLLTKEALQRHDVLTGTSQLRQFACGPCDNVWWQIASNRKAVSRCRHCRKRYDALPFEMQYGTGRFICQHCGHMFLSKCTATSICPCFECAADVSKPYIHPQNKSTAPRSTRKHRCDQCMGMGNCPNYRKVIYASKEHNSTGSTVSTFLSQADFGGDTSIYWDLNDPEDCRHVPEFRDQ